MNERHDDVVAGYISFYESLSLETISDLGSFVHENVRFKDPFSDVSGIEAYKKILSSMLIAVPDIRFVIHHCACDGGVCFLRWTSTATVKRLGKGPWIIQGVSELLFAPDGRIISHVDFWDASTQFYNRIPVLGRLISLIRQHVASH